MFNLVWQWLLNRFYEVTNNVNSTLLWNQMNPKSIIQVHETSWNRTEADIANNFNGRGEGNFLSFTIYTRAPRGDHFCLTLSQNVKGCLSSTFSHSKNCKDCLPWSRFSPISSRFQLPGIHRTLDLYSLFPARAICGPIFKSCILTTPFILKYFLLITWI